MTTPTTEELRAMAGRLLAIDLAMLSGDYRQVNAALAEAATVNPLAAAMLIAVAEGMEQGDRDVA